jgi:hypothetical protein
MLTTATLLYATLMVSQPADGPKLTRGQELIYRGTYSEATRHDGVPFKKTFDLEARVFVREAGPQGMEVAFCTILKSPRSDAPGSTRLELATVDPRGSVRLADGSRPPVYPDGPPVLECAGFLERPAGAPVTWTDGGTQPPLNWQNQGVETVWLKRCIKLVGRQESDWDHPKLNRPGWRRTEAVWLEGTTGLIERLERELECRSVGAAESSIVSRTIYELQGGVSTFPGPLADDRQTEIQQAAFFQHELRGLQANRSAAPAAYDKLIGRIDAFLEMTPATPFRSAIQAVRLRAEASRRGEPPPPGGP